MSYAMARLKADRLYYYRSNDPRVRHSNISDEADLRRTLSDDRHRELIAPGGAWWNHVHIFLAEQAGDVETVARLEAAGRAAFEVHSVKLAASDCGNAGRAR